ncbi:MAG: zincin-like metallopeptidase domain-containing protein [Massilia sp.]
MDTTETKKPFHVIVAEKLVKQLEQGTAPWQKPWEPGMDLPTNPVSGKRYRGINALHLMSEGRSDPRWLTYRQAQAMDAQVRAGEKGTTIQYWKFAEERPLERDGKPVLDGRGEPVKQTVKLERPRVFFATVFNAEQIDGLPPLAPRKEHAWDPIERAERILKASGAVIQHDERDAAYYRPGTDTIHQPGKGQFADAASYYAVSLHELGHWTGHGKRLDRDLAHPFGSEGYAREELRAEIASMMLGNEIGIGHDPQRHAAYVGSWIKALRDDPLEIFRAAAEAEKMCEYVLGLERKQSQDLSPEQASLRAEAAHPQAFVQPDGTLRDWYSGAAVPDDWQGVVKNQGAFWYVGSEGGERSFTVLMASEYQDAEAEAACVKALAVDIRQVLDDVGSSLAPYQGYQGESLEATMRSRHLTSIASVTGSVPAKFHETAEDRLSAVFRLEPGRAGADVTYLECARLAQAFTGAAHRLLHDINQVKHMNGTDLGAASLQAQENARLAMQVPTVGDLHDQHTPETTEPESVERQRRAEAWALNQLVQGTQERALDKASVGQLNRVEHALTAMQPLDPNNAFWERHALPPDVEKLEERIHQSLAAVAIRRLDMRVAAARLALITGQAFGRENTAEAATFDSEAEDALGFMLPHDWVGDVRVEGTITLDADGQRTVIPAEATGHAPEAWGVYARRSDGSHQWLANQTTEDEAERVAERLARIDAHSTLNEYEKAAKFARIHEARVRRSPDSTDEDLVAAKKARKSAEANMTLHDTDLQRRIEHAEGERSREPVEQGAAGTAKMLIVVPYKEKDEAKALGAKWDRRQQSWYVPADMDPAPFSKWLQRGAPETGKVESPIATATQTEIARVYLAVPYSERGEARAAGALWDKAAGSWFAGPKGNTAVLAKWRPENVASLQDPSMTPREEFAGFLKSLGCVISGEHPIMDGKSHRISVEGEKYSANAGSGFYVGHLDGHPAGYAKNNKTGREENWKAMGYVLGTEDKARLAAEAATKLQEREAELAQRHEQAARRVATQLAKLVPADHPTPYMVAKGLGPQPGTFTDKDGKKTCLPAIDANGKQWTMQYVGEDGTKRFAKDSRKEGCFHVIGQGLDELANAPAIVIAEGYATAATLRQTLGYATVSAFDSGNLAPVAQALHGKYPDKPVVVACDDDRHLELTQGVNPGRTKGEEAARLVGGTALIPIFAPGENAYPAGLDPMTPDLFRKHQCTGSALNEEQLAALERMKQFTDFNDLANRSMLGRDGIERQVKAACSSLFANGASVEQQEVQQIRQLPLDTVQGQKPKRRRKTATIA